MTHLDPNTILAERQALLVNLTGPTGWITTHSGLQFSMFHPTPEVINHLDIAYGLAHTFRYAGMAEPPLTVAEHSILVSLIIEALWPENLSLAQAGLLHDAPEAYSVDIPAPVRKFTSVCPPGQNPCSWDEMEHRVQDVVGQVFGLPAGIFLTPEVRAADLLALCIEKRDLTNIHEFDYCLPAIPYEIKHLSVRFYQPMAARGQFVACGTRLNIW